jgi:hypothetical protein
LIRRRDNDPVCFIKGGFHGQRSFEITVDRLHHLAERRSTASAREMVFGLRFLAGLPAMTSSYSTAPRHAKSLRSVKGRTIAKRSTTEARADGDDMS